MAILGGRIYNCTEKAAAVLHTGTAAVCIIKIIGNFSYAIGIFTVSLRSPSLMATSTAPLSPASTTASASP